MQYKKHIFGPGETIRAVIRKLNHQGMTNGMLDKLLIEFNELNQHAVPRQGQEFNIPVFVGFVGAGDNDDMNKA